MIRLGIDLDGVMADFEHTFKDYVLQFTGFRDFKDVWDLGMTHEEASRTLEMALTSWPNFWTILNPLFSESDKETINEIAREGEVYFITSRKSLPPGNSAHHQSQEWLRKHGLSGSVIVSDCKGDICRDLMITHFIDDRPLYCNQVANDSPGTNSYLLEAPWNRDSELDHFVTVVKSLSEFLQRANKYRFKE